MAEETRLNDLRAVNYILNQRIATEWIYASEDWKKEARLFCVKGLAQIDMLTEIRDKLGEAIAKGYGFNKFRDEIVPYLISKGWTGEDEKSIGHRVRTIWNTNQASANASSLWQSIQETKDKFPYLQYVGSISGEKREEHKAFYGLVAPADDPIWQRIFPPNGYGCKCSVKQLTKGQAERIIKQQEENGGRIVASEEAINKAVDKSFQHNHEDLSGFFGSIEKREKNSEETNLQISIAVKKNLIIANSPVKSYTELLKDADTLFNGYEKLVKDIEKGNFDSGFQFTSSIFKGENVSTNANYPFYFPYGFTHEAKKINEAINRYPKNIIQKLEKRKIFFFPYLDGETDTRAYYTEAIVFEDLDNWEKIAKNYQVMTMKDKTTRPFNGLAQLGDGLIFLPPTAPIDIPIHEIGHGLQTSIFELQKFFQDYFNVRTADKSKPDNNIQKLSVLLNDEDYEGEGILDDFVNGYWGRVYGKKYAKELLTKSYEVLLGNNSEAFYNFFKKDPNLFGFALASLVRFGK